MGTTYPAGFTGPWEAAMAATAILDEHFEPAGEGTLDERNRVALTKAVEALRARLGDLAGVRFEISFNRAGQVLLSPAVSVAAHEAWLYRNPRALAQVREGLTQSAHGETAAWGSFAKYADEDLDE